MNRKRNQTVIASVIALMCSSSLAWAQCKENLELMKNKELAQEKVMLDDAHLNKQFKQAIAPLNWLLTNHPTFSTNLYIKGAEIFDELATKEKNPVRKKAYVDSLMIIYDLRIKNCGEEANVINRKAYAFFKYNYNGPAYDKILPLMNKALELNRENALDALVENYMKAVKITVDNVKNLSQDEIMKHYDFINEIVWEKIRKAQKSNKPFEKYTALLDENLVILLTLIDVNCKFVRSELGPKFKQDRNDLRLAKQIVIFMVKGECTDDPLWFEAAETVHAIEKDFGIAKNLGIKYLSLGKLEKAEFYFKEALKLAPQSSDKADMLALLGLTEAKKGNKAGAREFYRQALVANPAKKEVYSMIGDLYAGSFDECAEMKRQADDRLVFLIAYDMYQRGGDTKKMNDMKSSFPSREELFLVDKKSGQKATVACWINEETILRTRD